MAIPCAKCTRIQEIKCIKFHFFYGGWGTVYYCAPPAFLITSRHCSVVTTWPHDMAKSFHVYSVSVSLTVVFFACALFGISKGPQRDSARPWNPFSVQTDNNPLKYVMSSAKLDATGQWLGSQLSAFGFEIQYRRGRSNSNADIISRMSN